jgi:hypothetical protein
LASAVFNATKMGSWTVEKSTATSGSSRAAKKIQALGILLKNACFIVFDPHE